MQLCVRAALDERTLHFTKKIIDMENKIHNTETPHHDAKLPVSGSVLEKIRQAFADYYESEGCSCCRNESKHDEAEKRLAELLKPDMYEDGSGFNWYLYASTDL